MTTQTTSARPAGNAVSIGRAAYGWWTALNDPNDPAARRQRAELRRARTLAEVAMTPAYVELLCRLERGPAAGSFEQAAAVASVLAQVKRDQGRPGGSIARQMRRRKGGGDRAPVSELRFRRLLGADDREELATRLRRVIPMLGEVAIEDLASSIFFWGDDRKRSWAEAYWRPTVPTEADEPNQQGKEAS